MSLSIGLSIGIDRAFANAPGYIGPGVIAFDSAAGWTTGQNPPAISVTLPNDGTVQVGDWYRIEYANNVNFTSSLFGNWYQITSNDVLNNGVTGTTYPWGATLAAGATWFRQFFGRGPNAGAISITSSASNVITDTLNAAVSSVGLATTTGTNKNSLLTVSGTPATTFVGQAGGAKHCARTLVEQASSKAQFEVTQNSGGATANYVIGIDDGTANLNSDIAPGYNTNTGIALNLAVGAYATLSWNSSVNNFSFVNNVAGTVQDADKFTLVYDYTGATAECWRTRSGTTVQLGSQATGLPTLTHHYAFAGSLNTAVNGTLNFGPNYAKPPGTGVAAQWAP